ncbi:slyX domain-containing protein [Fusarium globosum]|uniref:SlyX domain-containing protein n=1 Tax=Fusarium globosum TaxID=78864 RepID=A0A8H5YPY5_9HYPO|nr:slyX domain-containing protein [Fusarium globosum]
MIDGRDLSAALRSSGLRPEQLRHADDIPKLMLPRHSKLQCFRGKYRVEAAQAILHHDLWWAVDLFANDISEDLKSFLSDEYMNERKFCDGELFFHIRVFQKPESSRKNDYLASRWLARLASVSNSQNRFKNFNSLLGQKAFLDRFDRFLKMSSLLHDMKLSTLNKVLSKRFRAELLTALDHVFDTWREIFEGDMEAMAKLDVETVIQVQNMAPGAFAAERLALNELVEAGNILGSFGKSERERIWERICKMTEERLMPSLKSFFQNVQYLESAGESMKQLVDIPNGSDIHAAFRMIFQSPEQDLETCLVQTSPKEFKIARIHGGTRFQVAYWQLWLYAIREFRDMGKSSIHGCNAASVLHRFALLAKTLGFHSDKIESILQQDPDLVIAREFLLAARRPSEYEYENFEDKALQLRAIMSTARPRISSDTSDIVNLPKEAPARCGILAADHHLRDQPLLFLDKLLSTTGATEANGSGITSFFIQKSHFYSFFGKNVQLEFLTSQETISQDEAINRAVHLPPSPSEMSIDSSVNLEISAVKEGSRADDVHATPPGQSANLDRRANNQRVHNQERHIVTRINKLLQFEKSLITRIQHLRNTKKQTERQVSKSQYPSPESRHKGTQHEKPLSGVPGSTSYGSKEFRGRHGPLQTSSLTTSRERTIMRRMALQEQPRQNETAFSAIDQSPAVHKRSEADRRVDVLKMREKELIRQGKQLSANIARLHERKNKLQTEVDALLASKHNEISEMGNDDSLGLILRRSSKESDEPNELQRRKRHRTSSGLLQTKRQKQSIVEFWKMTKTWQLDNKVQEAGADAIFRDYCRRGYALLDHKMQVLNLVSFLALIGEGLDTVLVVPDWELKDLPSLDTVQSPSKGRH